MTTITIELSNDLVHRTEAHALAGNETVSQYVERVLRDATPEHTEIETVVRKIRALGPHTDGVRVPTADLAHLPISKGGIPVDWHEQDDQWDTFEAQQKALERAHDRQAHPQTLQPSVAQ